MFSKDSIDKILKYIDSNDSEIIDIFMSNVDEKIYSFIKEYQIQFFSIPAFLELLDESIIQKFIIELFGY